VEVSDLAPAKGSRGDAELRKKIDNEMVSRFENELRA
jgi:hypothetical protein